MPTRLWRFFALAGALCALCFVLTDAFDVASLTDDHLTLTPADGHTFTQMRVTAITGSRLETGGLQIGDRIEPVGGMTLRMRMNAEPAGSTFTWIVHRSGMPPFRTQTHVTPLSVNELIILEIFDVVRIAMILVGMLVATRRPEEAAARALVSFLIVLAAVLVPGGNWLPDWALGSWRVIRFPMQIYALSQALLFACIFPSRSERGLRVRIYRINGWYTLVSACAGFALAAATRITGTIPDLPAVVTDGVTWLPLAYFPLLIVAFTIGVHNAAGSDRVRAYWASGAIGIGFLGPLVQVIAVLGFNRSDDVMALLPLTLVALPLGLAYTILRHRTVDVGFVISRALVLTLLSFAVIAIFGLLERALGKLFIDASHIASRSVEIALAIGLGFSLRTLHARIERIVDRLFFRQRQLALASLRSFSADVYQITDPGVAIARTVEVAGSGADAENAALYLVADGVFGRAAALHDGGLPAEIDANDPLLVRMRASRKAELARETGTGINAEIAYPMFVRGTLVGALALTAKRSGEAYDPEETALLTDLAQRVGLALDALQTLAMRRELEALLAR